MSELEDILEKKDGKKQKKDSFDVHRDYVDEIMDFAYEHGSRVQKATYKTESICPDGIHCGKHTYQVTPDIYLLETKYGQIKITEKARSGYSYVEVEYKYSTKKEQEEIKKLFHEEKMTYKLKEKAKK